MNKKLTKIVGVTLGLSMAVGVGAGIAISNSKQVHPVYATTTTVASFSRSGTTNTVNGGTFSFAAEAKTGYYQDGSGTDRYIQILSNSAYWTTTPASISLSAVIGGGTGNKDLSNPVYVSLLDSTGSVVASTKTQITDHIATNVGDTYSGISIPATNNIYGVRISHVKESGYNVRYYSFDLSYEPAGGGSSATVTGVSITGDMNRTYSSEKSWGISTLSANVTMNDGSDYTGSVSFTCDPATPGEYIKNNGGEVSDGTVRVTANASGVTGYKDFTGINITYANVEQITAATPASGTLAKVAAKGIVSQIDSIDTSTYKNANYYISDDGTTSGQYKVYRGKGVNNADFTNVNDLKVGDVVVVYGTITTYNGTKEFDSGNYLLSLDRPASLEPSITISESNFTMHVGDADVTLHETHENVPDGGSVKWVSGTPATATIDESTGVLHALAAGTTVVSANILNSSEEIVASNSITVTVKHITYPVSDGDSFVVKYTNNTTTYYFTEVNNKNVGLYSETKSDAAVFTAEEGETSNQFYLKFGSLYLSYSGSNNNVYTSESKTANTLWNIYDDGFLTFIESAAVSGRYFKFNTTSGSERFCCYTSESNIDIELVEAPRVSAVTVAGDTSANANGELLIVKNFLYEVSYVNPLVPGNESVNVAVKNSNDGTEGASVTSAPSNGEFGVTFTANDTYTITVTSVEDSSKSDSMTITISNIYVPVSRDFVLYEGTEVSGEQKLVEGDYVINYKTYALKAGIASNRAQNGDVSPVENVIATADSSIVWHIAPAGEYYTIYNAAENKYLAATGSKNQAQLLANGTDDKAKWSVTVSDGKFEFENVARAAASSDPNNKWLRNNAANGWACYATGTGGALNLYRLSRADYLKTISSVASLHGNETTVGGDTTVDSVSMRLGALVSKANWDSINAEWPISDYGVMLFRTTEARLSSVSTVEEYYNADPSNVTIISKGSGNAPTLVDGFYDFSVQINFTKTTNFSRYYVAAPYIVAGGNYYFLEEMQYSVNVLAEELLANGGSDLSDEALLYLATTH